MPKKKKFADQILHIINKEESHEANMKYCPNLIDQFVNTSIRKVKRGHTLQLMVTLMDAAWIILFIHSSTEAQCPPTKFGGEMRVVDFKPWQSSKNSIR